MDYLIQEVFDHIFQNHTMMDFTNEYPASWIDEDNAVIHLAKVEGVTLFKLRIFKG